MKCFKNRLTTDGFSLLELLLSIAIISLIILMATRYFSTVRSNQKVSEGVSMIQGVRSATGSLIASSNPGAGSVAATICANNLVPAAFCNNGKLVSPWETTAGNNSDVAITTTGYTITIAGITDSGSCNNLKTTFSSDVTPGSTSLCAPSGVIYTLTLAFSN